MRTIFVVDITLASILDACGIPKRPFDPVTREVREYQGKDVSSGKWWFDITDDAMKDKAHILMGAYAKAKDWEEYSLDPEHPLYWMKGFAENRAANLHLFHHGATEMNCTPSQAWLSFEDQMLESRGPDWWEIHGQAMQTAYFMGIMAAASSGMTEKQLVREFEVGLNDAMKLQTGGKNFRMVKVEK